MTDELTLWHNRRDTLLRVERVPDDAKYCKVRIPVGIHPGWVGRHNITVEFSSDARFSYEVEPEFDHRQMLEQTGEYARIGLDPKNNAGCIKRISQDFISSLRYTSRPDLAPVRPYLAMERIMKQFPRHAPEDPDPPAYYEATLEGIPVGHRLTYRIRLYSH